MYAVLPAAAMFMVGYNWLSNHVGSRALFHLTITPFFAFYALFAFVMYPMRAVLHHSAGVWVHTRSVFAADGEACCFFISVTAGVSLAAVMVVAVSPWPTTAVALWFLALP